MLTFDIWLTKRNAYVHVPMAKSNALQAVEDNFITLSFLILNKNTYTLFYDLRRWMLFT